MKEYQARKRFGQNFLRDKGIINAIVDAARVQPHDTVIEIGPGLAALTEPLADRVDILHVVEIDRDVVAYLKTLPFADKLVIHQGDVLQFDFGSVAGSKKIIGNLPYNISTPLLFRLSGLAEDVVEMHFMLQKEVVERMAAVPETADYGRLSVMMQYFFDIELLMSVPPQAFYPVPKVYSAVVRLVPQKGRIGLASDFEHFGKLVKAAFAQRRKTVYNNLKGVATSENLQAVGINPQMRAEQIAPQQYVELSNFLKREKL